MRINVWKCESGGEREAQRVNMKYDEKRDKGEKSETGRLKQNECV